MVFIQKKYYNLFLALFCFILLIIIFKWGNYLVNNKYIIESFTNESIRTSHTVNLPLTTRYSCNNFCGPTARCSITGQQCFTDIDCPGCQPYDPPSKNINESTSVPGNDGAGKLTWGMTPQYSPLTTGYGTQEKIITDNMFSKPYMPNFGINTWLTRFNKERKIFNRRYKPPRISYTPDYPKRYSLTGEFIENGPLASNAIL
jgi:hypothetical protein